MAGQTTLTHQRPQEDFDNKYSRIDEWYKKGVDTSKVATKFRKGACENCGAMTHQKKDCLDRPRKIGAKFTNANIAFDEFVQPNLTIAYDGKRDRWAGYDPANHREIVEEYQKIEEAKREMKAQKLNDNPDDDESSEDEDDDKYADAADMPGTKVDSKQRITVRNLRIREDTAKYLRNLDPNSAFYDPKTRSMRENPNPSKNPEDVEFAGENFVRYSGDTHKHAEAQLFAWDAHSKGVDVHTFAEPTKLELLQKEYETKKEEIKSSVKDSVLDKYGGDEYLKVPPKQLLLAQTENYVEYSRDGRIIKGAEKQIIRSKYEEDVYPGNHSSIWGSYWNAGRWGYKCCQSFFINSYCCKQGVGVEMRRNDEEHEEEEKKPEKHDEYVEHNQDEASTSKQKSDESEDSKSDESSEDEDEKRSKKRDKKRKKKKKQKEKRKEKKKTTEEKDALKKALEAEDRMNREYEELMGMDERKRKYNSMYEAKEPTQEEIEAYHMKRNHEEDPMAEYLAKKKKKS